jgi:hypothetical protein
MKYIRVYRLLRRHGHSAMWAAMIILDASRGERHALDWIKGSFWARHDV